MKTRLSELNTKYKDNTIIKGPLNKHLHFNKKQFMKTIMQKRYTKKVKPVISELKEQYYDVGSLGVPNKPNKKKRGKRQVQKIQSFNSNTMMYDNLDTTVKEYPFSNPTSPISSSNQNTTLTKPNFSFTKPTIMSNERL